MNGMAPALEAQLEHALALYRAGRYGEALQGYEAACAQPGHRGPHGRGDCLLALGRTPEAVAAYRDALQQAPRYFRTHLNLATALAQLQRLDEALFHARQADRFKPGDPHIQALLARLPAAAPWQDPDVAAPGGVLARDESVGRVLLVYAGTGITDPSQTTHVYQAWGLMLKRAFEARGWQVLACAPAELGRAASPALQRPFDFGLLLDYSGTQIAELLAQMRRHARRVAYFNESADPRYAVGEDAPGCPDFYYQASLCGPAQFDHRAQWAASPRLRVVPAFRTLAAVPANGPAPGPTSLRPAPGPSAQRAAGAVLVNGPFPPRYAPRFEAQLQRGLRLSVDVSALVQHLRRGLPETTPVQLLLPDLEQALLSHTHEGQPRPWGLPQWQVQREAGVTFVEPMALDGLRILLSRCAHYVVTHQESFGGLVLDALSMGLTVHYPRDPLTRGHALVALRTHQGFQGSRLPQLQAYASFDELLERLRQPPAEPAALLEPWELVAQMARDAACPGPAGVANADLGTGSTGSTLPR